MLFYHRWSDRNLTRLEYVVVAILLSLVLLSFFRQVFIIMATAERTAINRTVANINSSLTYHVARLILTGEKQDLNAIDRMNPMTIMTDVQVELLYMQGMESISPDLKFPRNPGNYIGELYQPDLAEIEQGIWYFDVAERNLIYTIKNPAFFYSTLPGKPRIRFHVDFSFKDNDGNGKFEPDIDEFIGVKLVKQDDYQWNI